jgi:D-alanine transfer protein
LLQSKAEEIGKDNTKSNQYHIRDPYWKLIKENKRKIKRDYEFNVNSPEFQFERVILSLGTQES